jgi:PAS domain S-box-containing protein
MGEITTGLHGPARVAAIGPMLRRSVQRAVSALPHGRTLPEDVWQRRHRALLVILWIHAVGLPIFALGYGFSLFHSIAHGAVLASIGLVAIAARQHRRLAASAVSMGLITSSALLVHTWGGVIEGHFHFFVMIALLALYEDWLPFLLAAAYVVVHHGLMGALDPGGVYNHPDAAAHPWKWAAIHGGFVVAAGAASVAAWRMNEDLRADTRRAYEQVSRSEARLAEAQRLAQIGSWEWDPASGNVTWSAELYRIFGLEDLEWTPSYEAYFSMVDEDDRAHAEELVWKAVDERSSFKYECTINRPDGTRRVIEAYGETVETGGPAPKLVGTAQDVTERREVETELGRREEIERDYRSRSDFLSRISHELRTPLNAILGFAQVLEMDDLSPTQADSVKQILKGGDHLLNLINEVLEISRLQAGNMTISLEPVEIGTVVAEALTLVEPLAAERQVTFVNKLASRDDCYVEADQQRLKQVLLNLLSNAIKYNREGGTVTVSLEEPASGRALILVTDTGMGIPNEKLEQVFVPFDRLGAEGSGVEGTGLGLTLSKLLLEAMNGTLDVESEPYIGSTFIVGLHKSSTQVAPGPPEEVDRRGLVQAGVESPRATIVYVEDNVSNLRLVERLLEPHRGVKLIPALEGNLGLELTRQHRPDLVLLDLHLPGIDGEVVLEQLKADPDLRETPVVVVSADATASRVERVLALGAKDFLTKPLDVARFLEVVNETLRPGVAA